MRPHQSVITRIRKLLNLANNNPNINEGLNAAAKASELMEMYRISHELVMADQDNVPLSAFEPVVDYFAENKRTFTDLKNPSDWMKGLMNIIAEHHHCKVYVKNVFSRNPDGSKEEFKGFVIVGRMSDIRVVEEIFFWLLTEILRIGFKEGKDKSAEWLNDFRLGAVLKLRQKLEEIKKNREKFTMDGYSQEQIKNALIRIDSRDSEAEKLMEETRGRREASKDASVNDGIAFGRGYTAADEIAIEKAPELSGENQKKLLQ